MPVDVSHHDLAIIFPHDAVQRILPQFVGIIPVRVPLGSEVEVYGDLQFTLVLLLQSFAFWCEVDAGIATSACGFVDVIGGLRAAR